MSWCDQNAFSWGVFHFEAAERVQPIAGKKAAGLAAGLGACKASLRLIMRLADKRGELGAARVSFLLGRGPSYMAH